MRKLHYKITAVMYISREVRSEYKKDAEHPKSVHIACK